MRAEHIIAETWRGISRRRGGFFLSTAVLAICLTLLSIFIVVTANVITLARWAGRRVEVYAFLADDADPELVRARIETLAGVASARYVSKQAALDELRADLGPDSTLVSALSDNPLPASIRIALSGGFAPSQLVAEIERKASLIPGVTEVWSGRETLARLDRIMRTILILDALVLAIVSLSVAFIVFGTVEAAVTARRREIEIMELVGAPRVAVRLPFMIEGALQGLTGGLASFLLTFGLHRIISTAIAAPIFPTLTVLAVNLLLGLLLGFTGAATALGSVMPQQSPRRVQR